MKVLANARKKTWRAMATVLAILLAGCTTVDYVKVRYIEVEPQELARECPVLIGRHLGCASQRGDIWEIRAPRPRDVRDGSALEILGHEFYCHAWLKQDHRDEKNVRREPSKDCVPPGRI